MPTQHRFQRVPYRLENVPQPEYDRLWLAYQDRSHEAWEAQVLVERLQEHILRMAQALIDAEEMILAQARELGNEHEELEWTE